MQISIILNQCKRGIYSVLRRGKQLKNAYCSGKLTKPHFVRTEELKNGCNRNFCFNQRKMQRGGKISRDMIRRRIIKSGFIKKQN